MPKAPTVPDAISQLKADHQKVRGLLTQLEETTERGTTSRTKLLQQIETEVKVHSALEEELFYPAYRDAVKKKEDQKLYYESLEEHHLVDLVLAKLDQTDPATPEFGARSKLLKELIEHHAEEEESEMFPKARKVMPAEELRQIGARMAARRKDLLIAGTPSRGKRRAADEEE